MVQGKLLQALVTQPVTAAIAHVQHPQTVLLRHQHHERRAHAAQVFVRLCAGEYHLVGGVHSLLGNLRHRLSLNPFRALLPVLKQAQHLAHRQRTGNLPRRRAPHAVTDNVSAVLDGKSERVFV